MKILCLLSICFCVYAEEVRYDGYEVHRVVPNTVTQLEALRKVEASNKFYFWKDVSLVNNPVDIMIPPHLKEDFQNIVNELHLDVKLYIDNVQDRIDNENKASFSTPSERNFGWTNYYPLGDIYDWMDGLAEQYPGIVTVVVGGRSYENREIRGIRISYSENNANNGVFLEAGIHAAEWIGPAVVTFMVNEILTSEDLAVREMAERHDWYIFPVFNPDGYEYSHTTDRLWRKTRVPYGNGCYGADPNRNWPYQWNTAGSSDDPCSNNFAGPYPFSEPCTNSTSRYISKIANKIVAYIAFHSYSQMILIPYGHSTAHVENFDELLEVGLKGAESLAQRFGTKYKVGNIAETIYPASGSSLDWVKGNHRTRITYAYELRDTGEYGALLPADEIIPSGWETLDSIVTILDKFNEKK